MIVINARMEKSDLSLNTYVQYVEDFKFWILAAGYWLLEIEIVRSRYLSELSARKPKRTRKIEAQMAL